ncbi:ACP phosphodiesterase [Desulfuromonas thiophila]|uniref:Acyl carrier protein phosphodiesterase n=1 Tax=Desulfuromonas thiophila TaxID=57664 RepID=A0A1G7DJN9_9BACT|nr:ACP phosphodiesterase [Desulfuromonas thiophila]SDE51722.1 Acyl carrier protein phosphodiesterase [Desulfuromonas thiophila]
MNDLLHLLFSHPEPDHYIGSLVADFVKGPLSPQLPYPPGVLAGMRRHRRVDSLAENHPLFRHSCQQLDARYGRYRGILVDLFYDHIAAHHWPALHPQPLDQFATTINRLLQQPRPLPPAFAAQLPRRLAANWLLAYREPVGIQRALQAIARRARQPNPLADGFDQLHRHHSALEHDCLAFIPQMQTLLAQEPA